MLALRVFAITLLLGAATLTAQMVTTQHVTSAATRLAVSNVTQHTYLEDCTSYMSADTEPAECKQMEQDGDVR